jgi:hypothetical protein
MGKQGLFDQMREFIGAIAFKVFLWAYRMTNDEYLSMVYEDARREYESEKANAWLMK